MKKIIALTLALVMGLALAACGTTNTAQDSAPVATVASTATSTEPPAETPTVPESDNPLIAAEMKSTGVMNGAGTEVIGVRGYIEIPKESLKSITEEQYAEFCAQIDLLYNRYNWVSVICDDETGLQFTGAQTQFAMYGKLDAEGVCNDCMGYINKTVDGYEFESLLVTYPLNQDEKYTKLAKDLPELIYTTYAEDNGPTGTIYQFQGTLTDTTTIEANGFTFDIAFVDVGGNSVAIANMFKAMYNYVAESNGTEYLDIIYYPLHIEDFIFPEVGETANFVTIYDGYTVAFDMPLFYLGANETLLDSVSQ